MKKRLLILSDLWGLQAAAYLDHYQQHLAVSYDMQIYDSGELAGMQDDDLDQAGRHQHFVSGGIEMAVKQLMAKEAGTVSVLAFSVGGVIAWRAALAGLPIDQLVAVSATRLRYEERCPDCDLKLWYGELDPYQPNDEWRQQMNVPVHTLPGLGHDIYTRPLIIEQICRTALL